MRVFDDETVLETTKRKNEELERKLERFSESTCPADSSQEGSISTGPEGLRPESRKQTFQEVTESINETPENGEEKMKEDEIEEADSTETIILDQPRIVQEPRTSVLQKISAATDLFENSSYQDYGEALQNDQKNLAQDLSKDKYGNPDDWFQSLGLEERRQLSSFGAKMMNILERENVHEIENILEQDILRYASYRSQGMTSEGIDELMHLKKESNHYENVLEENDWYDNLTMQTTVNLLYKFASEEDHRMDFSF